MSKGISISKIKEQYADEWVLIEYEELDENFNVVKGKVLAHSSNRDIIYQELLKSRGKKIAIEYMGTIPEDVVIIL